MRTATRLFIAAALASAMIATNGCQDSAAGPSGGDPGPVYFTVAFDPQGGGSVPQAKLLSGVAVSEPVDLADGDLVFGGWYTEAACSTRWDFDDPVAKDMTLYAKWNAADTLAFTSISGGAAWEVAKGSGTLDADLYLPAYYKGIPVTGVSFSGFINCSGLTSVILAPGIKRIGSSAFAKSGLASIVLPSGIEELGGSALNQTLISQIRIPASMTSIAASGMANCKHLTQVTVDGDNPNYTAVDGVLFNKAMTLLVCYPAGKAGSEYSIPAGVKEVGAQAFLCSSILTKVIIPTGVTALESHAFAECPNLHEVNIPSSITSIGNYAFAYCFYWTAGSIFIPDSVAAVGYNAFLYCSKLSIRCQAASMPDSWDSAWNPDGLSVAWNSPD
jgi:uncharacterized repeat protein (TIGR02543 family)